MSEIDTKLYDAMGQRFAVVKNKETGAHEATAVPDFYKGKKDFKVVARNLKYSEAQGIVKLLGGITDGTS